MPVETAPFINGLDADQPANTDLLVEADDHMRLIKAAIKATLPNLTGAMIATQTELNLLAGATGITTIPTDVSNPSPNEILRYNGTHWVNSAEAGGGGGGSASSEDTPNSYFEAVGPHLYVSVADGIGAIQLTTAIPISESTDFHMAFTLVITNFNTNATIKLRINRWRMNGSSHVLNPVVDFMSHPDDFQPEIPCRFGHAGGFLCMWFGELGNSYFHNQFRVEDISLYTDSADVSGFIDNWVFSHEDTAFDTVTFTVSSPSDLAPSVPARLNPAGSFVYMIGATGDFADLRTAFDFFLDTVDSRWANSLNQGNLPQVTFRFETGEAWNEELYLKGDFRNVKIDATDSTIVMDGTGITGQYMYKHSDGHAPHFAKSVDVINMPAGVLNVWLFERSIFENSLSNFILNIEDSFQGTSAILMTDTDFKIGVSFDIVTPTNLYDCVVLNMNQGRFTGNQGLRIEGFKGVSFGYVQFNCGDIILTDCDSTSGQVAEFDYCSGCIGNLNVLEGAASVSHTNATLVRFSKCNLTFLNWRISQPATIGSYRVLVNGDNMIRAGGDCREDELGSGALDIAVQGGSTLFFSGNIVQGTDVTKNAFNTDSDMFVGAV